MTGFFRSLARPVLVTAPVLMFACSQQETVATDGDGSAIEKLDLETLDKRFAPASKTGYVELSPEDAQTGFILVDGDITSGGTFHGDGSGLTNLDASQITTGTLSQDRLPLATLDERYKQPDLPEGLYVELSPDDAQSGVIHVDGDITSEGTFHGDGSGLTGLDASKITTGTLAEARLPLAALDGRYAPAHVVGNHVELSPLDAQPGFILVDGDITSEGTFHGDGSGLTGLDASKITAGTLSQDRLPLAMLDERYAPSTPGAGYVELSPLDPQSGFILVDGNVTTTGTFHGNGSGLTNLDASKVTVGTLSQDRLPLAALDERYAPADVGAGYVALSPAATQSGFIRVDGNVTTTGTFHGDGSGLTNLHASEITAGILSQDRLPDTIDRAITLSNEDNAFTGALVGKVLLPREASPPFACNAGTVGATYLNTTVGLIHVCTHHGWTPVGKRPAQLVWETGSISFGNVGPNAETKVATLTNVGGEDAYDLALDLPEGLSLVETTCDDVLAANDSCTATLRPLLEGTAGSRRFLVTATSSNASGATLVGSANYEEKGSAEYPGRSCYDIKRQNPGAQNGNQYWIDPDGPDTQVSPRRVYCEMSIDGGGWTYFAHQSTQQTPAELFGSNVGTYQLNRGQGASYSIGGDLLPHIPHNQMMVSVQYVNLEMARAEGRLVFFEYATGHPAFNSGPLPCPNLTLRTQAFNFRVQTSGPFTTGAGFACSASEWITGSFAGESFPLVGFRSGNSGTIWGRGMTEEKSNGGENAYSYWYVREGKP